MANNDNELLQELKKISELLADQNRRIKELEDYKNQRGSIPPEDEYFVLKNRAYGSAKVQRFMGGSFLVWGIVLLVVGLSSASKDYSQTQIVSGVLFLLASILFFWYSTKKAQ